jgi:glucose/arabinose dehydrogenase
VIDHNASGPPPLQAPNRESLVKAVFPSLSGASKLDFVPEASQPFREFRGSAIVALWGDRAPFASGGKRLRETVGYKIVRVDVDGRLIREFISNTEGIPASQSGQPDALERPIDVKFARDGSALYILDFGQAEIRDGREQVKARTGRLFRLVPLPPPSSAPALPGPQPPPANEGVGVLGS